MCFVDKDESFESEKSSRLVTDGETSGATVEKEQTPPVTVSKSVDRKTPSTPNCENLISFCYQIK